MLRLAPLLFLLVAFLAGCSTSRNQAERSSSPPSTSSIPSPASSPTPRPELTRDSVLSLVGNRMTKEITAYIPSRFISVTFMQPIYKRMMDQNVMHCTLRNDGEWENCKPGPNGKDLRINSQNGR